MIVNANCRDIGPHIAADVIITDPPYSAHVHRSAVSQSKRRGARKRDLGFDHLSPSLRSWLGREVARARKWSVVYSDIEHASWLRIACQAAGAKYIRTVPWVRWSMPQLSGDRPPQGCELVLLFWGSQKGRKSWRGPGNLTHLAHKCLRGEGKHKAEKPLDQALDLVSWFAEPGEVIWDPFAGSGTVGLAARLLGRRYLGAELDASWAQYAAEREQAPLSPRDSERLRRWEAEGNALPVNSST